MFWTETSRYRVGDGVEGSGPIDRSLRTLPRKVWPRVTAKCVREPEVSVQHALLVFSRETVNPDASTLKSPWGAVKFHIWAYPVDLHNQGRHACDALYAVDYHRKLGQATSTIVSLFLCFSSQLLPLGFVENWLKTIGVTVSSILGRGRRGGGGCL